MQTKGGASGHAKTDRNARHKRLNIRRTMKFTGGVKRPLHSGQAVAGGDEKRNTLDCVDVPVSNEGTEKSTHEKKLKGLVGNVRDESPCSYFDSSECSDVSVHEQPRGDVTVREGSDRGKGSKSIAPLSFGSISVMGRRRVMEDALTVAPRTLAGEYEFFAAYDGHGGSRVAYACRDRLHHLLEKELEGKWRDTPGDNKPSTIGGKDGIDWTKVLEACFSKMDEEVQTNRVDVEEEVGDASVAATEAESGVGSTAVVALVGTEELVVANCGDSRAVLRRGGVALPLSNDHKPDRPDEKERVEAAGGRIINWDGSRVQGVLATSRSIAGDHYLKPFVISTPEVTVNKRTDLDSFLIIATDGLWDVVSNDVACEVVNRCLNGQISKNVVGESGTAAAAAAAAILAELAIAKGSRDNTSVIVVDLRKPCAT